MHCEYYYYGVNDCFLSFTLQDMISFELDISPEKNSVMLSNSKSLDTYNNSIQKYNRTVINVFMKKYYNKDNYIKSTRNHENMPISYIKNDKYLQNTILIQHNGLHGLKILNYKYFKYTIVMINCLLKAISKHKKNEEYNNII